MLWKVGCGSATGWKRAHLDETGRCTTVHAVTCVSAPVRGARSTQAERHAPPPPSPDLLLFHRSFSSKFDGKKRSWFLCGLWLQGLTPRSQCSASVPPACALVSSAAPISSYRRFIKRNLRQILVIKLKNKTSLMWIFFGHHRGLVYWIWIESCLLRRLRKMGCPTPAGCCEVKDHHVAFGK